MLVKPLFAMIDLVCVQHEEDAARFASLGIDAEKIQVTGSIKFDPSGGALPQRREAFQAMLDDFGASRVESGVRKGRPVVLLASTHAGEEKLLAQAVSQCRHDIIPLVVPRHAERRDEVKADLEACGYEVIQRSDYRPPRNASRACLLVDSTGELRDWTAHADVVVIGKSWLGTGGQNPAEAIAAGVPVITGPDMGNFEPLAGTLGRAGAIRILTSADELAQALDELLGNAGLADAMCEKAAKVLASHGQAMQKTLELLHLNASVVSQNV